MPKFLCAICLLLILTVPLNAAENQTLKGRENKITNWVDASIEAIELGPEMPSKIFNALGAKFVKEYASAQYRLVFTRAEIYTILFVDFLAIWEEGDRVIINSYSLPLDGYIIMKFIKWNSYNEFELVLETLNDEKKVNIKIMRNGTFLIKEMK